MGIINRAKDPTEQRVELTTNWAATATGVTLMHSIIPWACSLEAAQIAAWGLSGSPGIALYVNRFIAGTGFTTIQLASGASNFPAEFGTSGPGVFGQSIFGASGMFLTNAVGSTLNQLLANDVIVLATSVANTAVKALTVSLVVRPTQDLRTRFGID